MILAQLSPESAASWEQVGIVGLLITALVFVVVAFSLGEAVFFGIVPAKQHKTLREDCEARLEKIRVERDEARAENKRLWAEKVEEAKASAELAEAYLALRQAERKKER